ncbi:MAG: TRAP transporter large permease subunit [Rhizobiales bacterium]|nr:TRAP transporter large permease subunit [Hyphomicrobiales bacterium]
MARQSVEAAIPPQESSAGRPARALGRAFDILINALNAVGTVWIFVIMVLINADVFARYLFNRPLNGVPLIIELSIVAIVFLQLAAALREGRMTRSDVLIGRLLTRRPQLGLSLQAIYHALGAVLMGILFFYSAPLFEKAWRRETYTGVEGDFTLQVWPLKLIILLGVAVCGVQFLRHVGLDLKGIGAAARAGTRDRTAPVIALLSAAAVFAVLFGLGSLVSLSPVQIGLISVLFVLFLVYVGVHVGVALALLSFVCVWLIRGNMDIAGTLLALAASESLQRYEFGVIPLFVFMGLLVSVSDIGKDTYDVANHLFRRVKAGLGMATVGANAVFAAVTGTSIASASVFTKVAVPEMLRFGYKPRFAVGVVAGSSVLGMLIPPSLLLILYGILAETSIGDLFIAGIVPGIILAAAYCVLIWFMARHFPDHVAAPETLAQGIQSEMSGRELALKIAPIVILIMIVLGGIYGGVFTATEAGGVGAMGALIMTILKRRLTWSNLWHTLMETGYVTAAICFLLIAATLYARMIAMTGIPNVMESYIAAVGIGLAGLLAIYIVVVVLLGTIMSAGEIMLILIPIAVPLLAPFGVDLVWFGIVTIIAVEIGLLTPPLGIACFVIHNNLQDKRISLDDIFWGAAPFALTMLVVLILVTLFPQLALVLL